MMNVNLLALLLCAVAHMALGMLWYGPFFGKMWMKEIGFTKADGEMAKKNGMGPTYTMAFVSALITAFVLAQFLQLTQATTVPQALMTAFWAWLGFVATIAINTVLFEKRTLTVYVINIAYNLASLLAMSAILTLVR
jgi:hypothetical protein